MNASKWHKAQVNVSLPPNTQGAKVRIRGRYYGSEKFRARIDLASLSVYYYDISIDGYGNATLVTNIYYSKAISHPEWDGFVSAGFGISARAKDSYSVAILKDLKVELLPNNETDNPNEVHATTQDGRLIILYLTQHNSKNWTIRDLPLECVNIAFDTGHLVTYLTHTGVGVTVATVVALALPEPFTKIAFAGIVIENAITSTTELVRRVALEHPLAQGGTSYKVYETLDYSGHLGTDINDRIESAGAQYYFDWRFRTVSDDIFAIKVSATVQWARWTGSDWQTNDEWISTLSVIISLADYWQ